MQVIRLDLASPGQCAVWDQFCLDSDEAWFWHTTAWLRYQLAYKPELRSVNRSFMMCEGTRVLGICPLIEEQAEMDTGALREFRSGGGPGAAPAISPHLAGRQRAHLRKAIFAQIEASAAAEGVVRSSFRISPLTPAFMQSPLPPYNYLMEHGFIDISLNTHIVTATPGKSLWDHMRKSTRQNIRREESLLTVRLYDKDNITRDEFMDYRSLHEKAAGRVTRPSATFEMMYQWILEGKAALYRADQGRQTAGFILVIFYKDGAYFASAANDPAFSDGISHILHWQVLRRLGENGFRYYEMGLQQFAALPHDLPSKKELALSHFKRGFGGSCVPLFTAEKYYSMDFFRSISQARVRSYSGELRVCG